MINYQNLNDEKLDQNHINLINIKYNPKKDHINRYINNSFNIAFKIIKDGFTKKMINGPINKKSFLGKKFLGVTEFISQRFKKKVCNVNLQQRAICMPTYNTLAHQKYY